MKTLSDTLPQKKSYTILLGFLVLAFGIPLYARALPELHPLVKAEEVVYQYVPPNNGSMPMWCRGSTSLVRVGNDVFASGMETLEDVPPLNNCRWILFQRTTKGWKKVAVDAKDRTREPCPLVGFPDGNIFLSANPTLVTDRNASGGGPARPEVLMFSATAPEQGYETLYRCGTARLLSRSTVIEVSLPTV